MYSWAKEKEYRNRRAATIAQELETAIATVDIPRFNAAYQTALRYLNSKTRASYYKRMLTASTEQRKASGI